VKEASRNAVDFWTRLQTEDGHWGDDYGGPHFLIPGFVITAYITKTALPEQHRLELIRYLTNKQNEDGGWGLHVESESTSFGSAFVSDILCDILCGSYILNPITLL
jgi:lanosterol synthase